MQSLEISLRAFLTKNDNSPFARLVKSFLSPIGWLFKGIVIVRNSLYDRKLLKTYRAPIPVISVGNIIAGGTGKTPFLIALAKELSTHYKLAVLTRGYRSIQKNKALIACQGKGPQVSVSVCGDEAYLIAAKVPNTFLIVGKNRVEAAKKATALGAELILLDDGMQHRQLERDLEIVAIHCEKREADTRFLPRGLLRDHPKRLVNADFLVMKGEESSCITSQKPTIQFSYCQKDAVNETSAIPLQGRVVAIFCSIADPFAFRESIEKMGASVCGHRYFSDHQFFSSQELVAFSEEMRKQGAECLICTEKDRVKLPFSQPLFLQSMLPIFWIPSDITFKNGTESWELLLKKINQLVKT